MIKFDLSEVSYVAKELIKTQNKCKLWAFYGEMGAGKTTLIKAICHELGVIDEVSSPTFSLVNEYKTSTNQLIFHFDFYRIKSIEEVFDIGYEDYFFSGNLCLIEWPELVKELLPINQFCRIEIANSENGLSRVVTY